MPERLFCCAGDIQFEPEKPTLGQKAKVKLKEHSETCNYLQYQKPLTKTNPGFFAEIKSLNAEKSVITIGIAGADIHDDIHPGNWNGTVGYRNTGKCYSSHILAANTDGEKFEIDDVFGVVVTYFGDDMSTVIFFKNGIPVATRYLFESDHSNFLPTITLEYGPIELDVTWPEAIAQGSLPKFSEKNMLHWIKPSCVHYDAAKKLFTTDDTTSPELVIQSPLPLSKDISHYEVVVEEVSDTGAAPTIAIATCNPLHPTPTCPLLNDYFRWHPDGSLLKMNVGQTMGWGVHYNPDTRSSKGFHDKYEQLVLCYVTVDVTVVYAKIVLQPAGGWYPVVMLHPYASKVKVDMSSKKKPVNDVFVEKLDELFIKCLPEAKEVVEKDQSIRNIDQHNFRKSESLEVKVDSIFTKVKLPKDKKGIHSIQFLKPLTPEQRYFSLTVRRTGDSSVVSIGVTDAKFPLNRYPGRVKDTVGYQSRDGKMYYNDKDNGNTGGQRYGRGDIVGLEMEVFEKNMSVALFSKNNLPVGTRFLTQKDHSEFLPTIAIAGNGSEVEIEVIWQNRISVPPNFSVTNIEHWCLPDGATVDTVTNTVYVETSHTEAEAIQAPYSLHRRYNHFEVKLIDDFDDNIPPPAIALCTASPFDPTPKSNFKQDFIRFWAMGEAQKAVKKGDLMGWGMLYPNENTHHDEEQLVICYLTINRDVALTRVMYQPPGGFYPVVLMPPGVNRVQLDFGATIITEHPFTKAAISTLVLEAEQMISEEIKRLKQGKDPEDWDSEENKSKYLRPVPKMDGERFVEKFHQERREKPSKMANLVEVMMKIENARTNRDTIVTDSEPNEISRNYRQSKLLERNDGTTRQSSKMCVIL